MPGGVYCIENWSASDASPDTVLPLLTFLRENGAAKAIHQRISHPRELGHYLQRFANQTACRVGYLALHGSRRHVHVGRRKVDLDTLITWSTLDEPDPPRMNDDDQQWVLDLTGKVLYLGSCATLRVSPRQLEELRRETGAIAICGYTRYVDFYEAAAVEVMLLIALSDATSKQRHSVGPALKRLWRRSGDLLDNLGFVSYPDYRPKARAQP
jgi:hypothetical protein